MLDQFGYPSALHHPLPHLCRPTGECLHCTQQAKLVKGREMQARGTHLKYNFNIRDRKARKQGPDRGQIQKTGKSKLGIDKKTGKERR